MAQQRKLTRKEKIERAKQTTVLQQQEKKKTGGNNLKLTLGLIAAAFGFLLYIGTVNYTYVLDDYSTIKQNYVVQQGLSGIPTILKTSYRYGYWSSNDELYRPLSLILFAVEWNFFPDTPFVGHLINILLYSLLGYLLFNFLSRLFNKNLLIPFITTILFMAHPAHTEVVANIKSGDELLSLIFIIVSINWLLDYIQSKKLSKIILSSFAFFLALMAKESALTLLAVIPLLLFVFKDIRLSKGFRVIIPLIIATVIYIIIRASVLHGVIHTKTVVVLDNVLAGAPDFISRMATAIYVLGRYLLMVAFPVHLSYDYSVSEITILKFTDYRVLISLALYLALIIYALYNIRKRDVISFGILFYLITISIVSNIFIIIGTVMADRLLFLPSLGFCIVAGVLLAKMAKAGEASIKITKVADFIKVNSKPFLAVVVILALYSFKTIDREPIWKTNWTLYQSGLEDSPNSSRVHYLVAIELKNTIAKEEPDSLKKLAIYKHSIEEFRNAIKLYPKSFDAYRDMGKSYTALGDTASALKYYDEAIRIYPHDTQAMNNLGTILFQRHQYGEARDLFAEAVRWDPRYADALQNLGSCYGVVGDYENALFYLFRSLDFEKDKEKFPGTYRMIGMTYKYMGNTTLADQYLAKAKEAQSNLK